MADRMLGIFVIATSWLIISVIATTCPVKFDIEARQASTEYIFDARFISSNITKITTTSPVSCIQRCVKECLCYHANYKSINATSWICQLVKYSKCGVRNGIRSESDNGWAAVKLVKTSEDPFVREYCCKPTELEQSMLTYCAGIDSMSHIVPKFDKSLSENTYKWRCYIKDSLDTYYFSYNSSLYYTRHTQLSAIFNGGTSDGDYKIGGKGQSCMETCGSVGKVCSSNLLTLNTVYLFHRLGFSCLYNRNESDCFTNIAHPVYYPSTGYCHGYINVPVSYDCAHGVIPDAQRLCKCVEP